MKLATNLAVIALLTIITIYLIMLPKVQPKTSCAVLQTSYDSLLHQHDSLKDICFPAELELNRYKIAYEIFMRRNPKAAQQYGTIVSNEVE